MLTGWRPQRDPGAGGRVFAVYAAEWWRRHYDGRPWAWQPLLDSIHCEAAFPDLYEPLRNAWRWWRVRPVVLGASVRYLGTCACQGGLPLHFVSSPHSNVRRFLRALLREYRTFRRVVDDGYTLAEPLRSHLPRSLRQEPVYRLCAEVMDQIWELRGVGSQQDDPVAELDRQTPEWRSRMPIDLGDTQARSLIDSLLRDAATAESTTAGEFQVLRYITETAAGRRFVVEPRVPQRMPVAGMAKLVGIGHGDLPGRFQLRVDGSRPLPIAYGRIAGDDVVFSGVLADPEDLAAVAPPGDPLVSSRPDAGLGAASRHGEAPRPPTICRGCSPLRRRTRVGSISTQKALSALVSRASRLRAARRTHRSDASAASRLPSLGGAAGNRSCDARCRRGRQHRHAGRNLQDTHRAGAREAVRASSHWQALF